jgi:hypothetical protein
MPCFAEHSHAFLGKEALAKLVRQHVVTVRKKPIPKEDKTDGYEKKPIPGEDKAEQVSI